MKTLIIACEVLKKEVELIFADTKLPFEIVYNESFLHEVPKKLHEMLQKSLDEVPADVGRVIFAYGLCGGSMNELETGNYELILPKTDDCIPLILGSRERFLEESKRTPFFLSTGWVDFESQLYNQTVEKVGKEKTDYAYKTMLANYQRFLYVDTGSSDFEADMKKMEEEIKVVGLPVEKVAGDLTWIKELILGPWPKERYFTFPAKSVIDLYMGLEEF